MHGLKWPINSARIVGGSAGGEAPYETILQLCAARRPGGGGDGRQHKHRHHDVPQVRLRDAFEERAR